MAGGELSLGRQTAPESGPQTWGYDPRRDLCSRGGATQRNKDFLFFFCPRSPRHKEESAWSSARTNVGSNLGNVVSCSQ